ncbi:MAG: tetratricopeptide repeat-containing sensor histidine kinase [Bacteroidales bacterium]|nr:tetratricopeptide repeat-containing sensor histidine kinase [Bacteroidales bacterium]
MNRLLVLILSLFIFSNAVQAIYINKEIDSLNSLLETSTDLEKIEILNELSKAYDTISYDKSLGYAKQALELTKKYKGKEDIAASFDRVARIYYFLSNYDESINYFIESLKKREKIGDKKAIAQSYNNLGVVYLNLNSDNKALEYLQKAWDLSEEIGDDELMKKTAINLGIVYAQLSNYYKSLEYYERALTLIDETELKQLSVCLNNIGLVYWYLEDYDKALECYLDALKINEQERYKWSISNCSRNVGMVYIELNDFNKASLYLTKALKIAKEIDSKHLIKDCYITFSDLYFAKGNYKNAYEYHEMYSDVKDSIFTEELGKNIAELEVKFETVKKEKEIEILKNEKEIDVLKSKKNKNQKIFLIIFLLLVLFLIIILYSRFLLKQKTNKILEDANQQLNIAINKISKSEEDLKELNATKDKFFSIIAHDLKAPFNSLLGFSEILVKKSEQYDKEKIKQYSIIINTSAHDLFNLSENLLHWARCQSDNIKYNPKKVDLNKLVINIIYILEISAKKKNITVYPEIPKNTYVYADANIISTVIRNLLSNALKFTEKGGEVTITSVEKDNFVEVSVIDTGIGISEENIKKLFILENQYTTKGTSDEKGTGLGLIICKEFIEKSGGEIWVESESGKGSIFKFTLPKTEN